MAPTIEALEAMSDAEVRSRYNEHAVSAMEGLSWYQDEIDRREVRKQTRALTALTLAIAVLTVVLVLIALGD